MRATRRTQPVKMMAFSAGSLILFACALTVPPPPTPDALQAAVEQTSTALAPTPTPTPIPIRACPAPIEGAPEPSLAPLNEVAPSVDAYLDGGGSVPNLLASIETGAAADLKGRYTAIVDLDGDEFEDVVFSLVDPESESDPASGTLFIFMCRGEEYQLNYTTPTLPELSVPVIHAARDLNGDGRAELVVGRWTCGANTCFEEIEVLMWGQEGFRNALTGSVTDLPEPDVRIFEESSRWLITVTGTGVNSVGAGPYRKVSRTWAWNEAEAAFTPATDVILPSPYRIHRLHDADAAFVAGDYPGALALYEQVIVSDELQDWIDPERERAVLSAYARFRTMQSHMRLGDVPAAANAFNRLQETAPNLPASAPFAELGSAFWQEYQATQDLALACSAAQAYAIVHASKTVDALYFGYLNPSYSATDICPSPPG